MNENAFEKYHLKKTKNRILILSLFEKSNKPLTALDIFNMQKKEKLDLSTIYRTLLTFEKVGLLKKEINEDKENIYSLIQKDTHILVCSKCHKRIPLKGCPFHKVNEEIEKETGFILKDQNVEIYGICKECQKDEKRNDKNK